MNEDQPSNGLTVERMVACDRCKQIAYLGKVCGTPLHPLSSHEVREHFAGRARSRGWDTWVEGARDVHTCSDCRATDVPPPHRRRERQARPWRTGTRLPKTTRPAPYQPPPVVMFIDVETTGLNPRVHEIIELGGVLVTEDGTAGVINVKVLPERIEFAQQEALDVNGYDPEVWAREAVPLRAAMAQLHRWLDGTSAMYAGHNLPFDMSFIDAAWSSLTMTPPKMDYHTLDTASLAWPLFARRDITSLSLDAVAAYCGIERKEHRALADAMCARDIVRHLSREFGVPFLGDGY